MVKKIVYCDRCGKECEEIRRCEYRICPSGDDYLDLCQKCSDDLVSWMQDVKAESLEPKMLDIIDFENIDDAINDLNYQAERIKNPTYSFLKKSYEMGAKALNIMKIMNTKSEENK